MISKKRLKAVTSLIPFMAAILLGVMGASLVKITLNPVIVSGVSMSPTYKNGDILRSEAISGKRSFNPVTKIMGTALSGTVKTGRYSSKAASLSVSKMSELASKGFDKGDERALVR